MAELQVGERAPEFELRNQNGRTVRLLDFRGRRLLLYFYPKAGTTGCTAQACALRDALPDLAEHGAAVAGISPDPPEKLKEFDDEYCLGFPLLSDPQHEAARAYGVWSAGTGEKQGFGKTRRGVIRSAFLIDEKGTVIQRWYRVPPEDTVPGAMQELGSG